MKTLNLTFAIIFISFVGLAQDKTKQDSELYANEIGVDITGLIKEFTYFNQPNVGNNYSPIYYITYRHKFSKGNIRLGLGGMFNDRAIANPNNINFQNRSTNAAVDLRIGYEFVTNLGKRSQLYYGIDFRPGFSTFKSKVHSSSSPTTSSYDWVNETQMTYGIAPILGYRFRITNRISFTTELSLTAYFSQKNRKDTQEIVEPESYKFPTVKQPTLNSAGVNFQQPVSITVTFDL